MSGGLVEHDALHVLTVIEMHLDLRFLILPIRDPSQLATASKGVPHHATSSLISPFHPCGLGPVLTNLLHDGVEERLHHITTNSLCNVSNSDECLNRMSESGTGGVAG